MSFFSNLIDTVLGRKKEEEQKQAVAVTPSQTLQPTIRVQQAQPAAQSVVVQPVEPQVRMPEIAAASLVKAPIAPEPAAIEQPKGDWLDQANGWINSSQKVAAPVWDVGEDASLLKKLVPGAYNILARPIANAAANFFVNAPIDIGRNLSQGIDMARGEDVQLMRPEDYKSPIGSLGQRLGNLSIGQHERAQDVIGDAGNLASDFINLATVGNAGNFIPSTSLSKAAAGVYGQTAMQGALKEIAVNSAIAGAKIGGASGLAGGLNAGRDNSVAGQIGQGALQGTAGAVLGGTVGFATPYVGYGIKSAFNTALEKVGVKSVNGVTDDAARLAAGTAAEVDSPAPGVKSVNPDRPVAAPEPTLAQLQNTTRPAQQIELESLINQNTPESISNARRIVDALPVTDPNKASMASLLDGIGGNADDITVYQGRGNLRPGGAGNNMFGAGSYFSPEESVAREFGDQITTAKINPKEILTLNSQDDFNKLLAETARTFDGDPLENLPKMVGQKGFRAVSGSPEAFGPEAGINMIPQEFVRGAADTASEAPAQQLSMAGAQFRSRPFSLPKELSKATPNYGYGSKQFTPEFASDVDKAAYIVTGKGNSASHAAYEDWLKNTVGMTDDEIQSLGGNVRAFIKGQAKVAEDGSALDVPAVYRKAFQTPDAAPVAAAAEDASAAFRYTVTDRNGDPVYISGSPLSKSETDRFVSQGYSIAKEPFGPVATPDELNAIDTSGVVNAAEGITPPVAPAVAQAATPDGQVETAPNLRAAVIKLLDDRKEGALPKGSPLRDVMNIEDTFAKARGVVNDMTPEDIVRMYTVNSAEELETMVRTPQDYAVADAALRKLYEAAKAGDTNAAAAADNVLSAMQFGSSKGGQFLRITQQAFDEMPVPMKINKILGYITKANVAKYGADSAEVANLQDPAVRTAVTGQMEGLFNIDQSIRDDIASAENALNLIKENPAKYSRADADAAGKLFDQATERLSKNTRDFALLYDKWVPGTGDAIDKIGNYQRTSMLSSFAGRVQDVLQTGLNAGREVNNSMVEGNIGKVLNATSGEPGKYLDTGINPWDLAKAVPNAIRKTAQEAGGVEEYGSIGDVVSNVKRFPDRTDISGTQAGPITRLVKAATNFATNLTDGVKEGTELRLLRQQGLQRGLKGEDLDTFIAAASFNPSDEIAGKASVVQQTVNNLNKNPFTDFMRGIGNSAEQNLGPTGKFIKNAVLPFPTWLGGNIWNSITDRNIIANSIKAVANANRDPQYAVNQLSKAITGVGEAYALGWVLTANDVLTDHDANGDSYDGIYLHLGNRYMPVSSLGAFAPNIILGYAANKGFTNDDGQADGEGILKNIGQTAMEVLSKSYKALDVNGLTGDGSYLNRGLGQLADDPAKGLSTIGAGFAGQFIPALSGDVNSILDNYTSLNPTHEAADTTVVDPNSASGTKADPLPTALNQLANRIPFLSQTLPREEGKAAKDMIDRIDRGNHETGTQVEERAKEMSLEDQKKDFAKRGVPHYDAKYGDGATFQSAVETKIENGEYDTAIEALTAKLERDRKNGDIPKSKIKDQEDDITKLKVVRDGKFDPSIIQTYKDTNLTEWRNMGDPESDEYDPEMYEKLWAYDTALANQKVSRNTTDAEKNFYSAKKKKASTGGTGISKKITSNTVSGSVVDLGQVNLSKITGKSTNTAPIAKVAKLKPGELVKKRKISVSSGR